MQMSYIITAPQRDIVKLQYLDLFSISYIILYYILYGSKHSVIDIYLDHTFTYLFIL